MSRLVGFDRRDRHVHEAADAARSGLGAALRGGWPGSSDLFDSAQILLLDVVRTYGPRIGSTLDQVEGAGRGDAVRALQRSEERFRLFIESVVDYAMFILDPEGHIETWNVGAERLKGYTADEILDKHYSVFYPAEDRDAGLPDRLLAEARDRGRVRHTGWRVREDGSAFWADVVITALRGEDGTMTGFAKVTRDMTESHEAQLARERALEEQHRALERLEEADAWRRDFISAVTHDLQSPLASIVGFVELLADDDVDKDGRRQFLERIVSNVRALEALVDHLRTYTLLETGATRLDPEQIDLADLVERLVADMEPVLARRVLEIDIEDVEVVADRRGLERVMRNLLANAGRHSHPGSSIRVRAESRAEDVVVEVQDEGEGVSEDLLPRMFDRFERGPGGGTGLGLSVVKQYVELHGGEVEAESEVGCGTTVRFTLPRPEMQ